MSYEKINLESLFVNERNDRHAELQGETEAIEWLLLRFGDRMKRLADDIVSEGIVYEAPIVMREGNLYRVFDGNRRIAALKIMSGQVASQTSEGDGAWQKLKNAWQSSPVSEIVCRVETDLGFVDDILFRKHNGANSGVGQTDWDDEARQNFLRRTGKLKSPKKSDIIVTELRKRGYLAETETVARSKLDRLFSSKEFQEPFGFRVKKGNFEYLADEASTLQAVQHAARDLSDQTKTLADIWDKERKLDYIAEVKGKGVLPEVSTPKSSNKPTPKAPATRGRIKRQTQRKHLIPNDNNSAVNWSANRSRIRQVWEELQFDLRVDKSPNAVSVLFRVLLDLGSEEYRKHVDEKILSTDNKFSNRLSRIAKSLHELGKIPDENRLKVIERHIHREDMFGPNMLNEFVHDEKCFPSDMHVFALWDNLEDFIVAMVEEIEVNRN